jgi:hypothetical protein
MAGVYSLARDCIKSLRPLMSAIWLPGRDLGRLGRFRSADSLCDHLATQP